MEIESKLLRFGPNELNLESYELRRGGVRVQLSRLPLDLLILLAKRRGALVTREEIAAHLWTQPDLVDTVGGINTAIKKIRAALNDDSGQPRFVETVIGRGYRFIGTVEEVEPHGKAADEQHAGNGPSILPALSPAERFPVPEAQHDSLGEPPSQDRDRPPHRSRRWKSVLAFSAPMLLVVSWMLLRTRTPTAPSLEPVQVTYNENENRVAAGAISSSGKLLAYIDPDGVFLRELKTGTTQRLKVPVALKGERVEWFGDDLQLLISGFNTQAACSQLWKLSITGAPPQLVAQNARNGLPSPDGTRLAFTLRNDTEIWLSGPNGEGARLFVKAAANEQFAFLFWGGGGARLSYQLRRALPADVGSSRHYLNDTYEWDYISRDVANARQVALVRNLQFQSALETGDGHLLYLHTNPWRDGPLRGIWDVSVEKATGKFRSRARQLAATGDYAAYGLSAAGDRKQIAAVWERGQPDVYVADLHQPGPTLAAVQRLTSNSKRDFPHAWTRDGTAVLFESDREGDFHLFRQALNERTAERLTVLRGNQIMPQLTSDGRYVLFENLRERLPSEKDALYRLALDGQPVQELSLRNPLDEFRCPLLSGSCVLRQTMDHQMFVFSELDPAKGQGRELTRTAWTANEFVSWALSPDGRTVALPISDEHGSSIRLVPLDAPQSARRETTLRMQEPGFILSLNWASDGLGWFAENRRDDVSSLVYVGADGHQHPLRDTTYPTWGVPSPDGRKLAFVDYTSDRNVWLWKP